MNKKKNVNFIYAKFNNVSIKSTGFSSETNVIPIILHQIHCLDLWLMNVCSIEIPGKSSNLMM